MPIDITAPGSPGWWMNNLYQQMRLRNRKRYERLSQYFEGKPPIIFGTLNTQTAFWQFQQSSRTNFAELIVQAPVDRQHVRAIRTAADGDESGDPKAAEIWNYNGLDAEQTTIYTWKKTFGEAYVSVGIERGDEYATMCPEDPRQTITAQHATKPWLPIAALKLFSDEAAGRDYAYLWLPADTDHPRARMLVAYQSRQSGWNPNRPAQIRFNPGAMNFAPVDDGQGVGEGYDGPLSAEYDPAVGVPVFRFTNRRGVGEFETHTDLIDRINHMVLQRLVIATMQAFRQRAIELTEDLPKTDPDTGETIDYDKVFSADPGALWKLPQGSKIWESAQADLSGILAAVQDDIKVLSAVTRTPLQMLTPDSANQTAEGADLSERQMTTKVEYDFRTDGRSWSLAYAAAFAMMGDKTRAKLSGLQVDWFPAKQTSISEAASADAQSSLPFEDKLRLIYQFTPAQIAAAKTNRADDSAFEAAMQAVAAPPTPPALPGPPRALPPGNNGQQAPAQGVNGGQQGQQPQQ